MSERPGLGDRDAFRVSSLLQDFNAEILTLLKCIKCRPCGSLVSTKLSVEHAYADVRACDTKAFQIFHHTSRYVPNGQAHAFMFLIYKRGIQAP